MDYYYDFGPELGGVQSIAAENADALPDWQKLIKTQGGGYQTVADSKYVQIPVAPQWADLQAQLQSMGLLGDTSAKTGANDGWVVEYNQDPNAILQNQMAAANPAGFVENIPGTKGYTPTVSNAHYVSDWNQALKDADDHNGFDTAVELGLAAMVANAGGSLFGGLGGTGASASAGAGALGAGEAAPLGSGISAGGGLGLTSGGGLGLAGAIPGLGTMGLDGAITASGLAGTGLGAGWGALGSGALDVGFGSTMTDAFPTSELPNLGSGISATGGTTGISGTITGDLAGSAGALGSTSGAAGLTGTIPGLGTLTADGMLIPAAGGAAVSLSSLSPSILSQVMDVAKKFLSPSSSSSTGEFSWRNALAGGLAQYLKMKQANNNLSAGQDAYNKNITHSPSFMAGLTPTGGLGTAHSRLPTIARHAAGGYINGLSLISNNSAGNYAAGGTSGQSDKIPAMLSDGEYVIDADTVAALGDGNNAAGAAALEQMRMNIRKHKRAAPVNKIPPKAKRPEQYLKGAK